MEEQIKNIVLLTLVIMGGHATVEDLRVAVRDAPILVNSGKDGRLSLTMEALKSLEIEGLVDDCAAADLVKICVEGRAKVVKVLIKELLRSR